MRPGEADPGWASLRGRARAPGQARIRWPGTYQRAAEALRTGGRQGLGSGSALPKISLGSAFYGTNFVTLTFLQR
jgi:hypothetical protein